jgi:hypothetical protein
MNAREYLQIMKPAKRHKYGAVAAYRCSDCGCPAERSETCIACGCRKMIRFASKAEAQRYDALMQDERFGIIKNLRLQVPFHIKWPGKDEIILTYVADFVFERDGKTVVMDCKGFATKEYRIKKKLLKAALGIDIVEVA